MRLATYLLYAWIGLAIAVFVLLFFISAPYGRHTRRGWGFEVPVRTSWFLMEFPSLAIMLYFLLNHLGSPLPTLILALFWVLHYSYRTILFPLLIRPGSHRTPITIILFSELFNIANATFNGLWLFTYPVQEWSVRFFAGLALMVLGFFVHAYTDHRLRNLRKPGETGYKIPRGWLFDYVTSPNYLGEIVEWLGFALAAWNLAALAFLIWTISNLLPRAIAHHRWYLEKFPDYPKERKALIPFLL